jgi:hypothetical protein
MTMNTKKNSTVNMIFRLAVFTAAFTLLVSPLAGLAATLQEDTITMESASVCSPETHQICLPGPFSKTITVPQGVSQVSIDVYWVKEGTKQVIQPNEHSWFTANAGGKSLGSVYCRDFGDVINSPEFCGSVKGDVSPGETLNLTIEHADESEGVTPGSHRQIWQITWIMATQTPPPPTVTNTPQPTPTLGDTPPPQPTASPTVPQPEPTIVDQTPTATDLPPTETPAATQPADTPVTVATSTPEPIDTLPPPSPPPGAALPTLLVPVTGADSTDAADMQTDPEANLFLNSGLVILGMALVFLGIRRKISKM